MDLTPEGAGDMDPAALARLDLVLGAFHSKLRLRDDQIERYFRGLENPDIHVLTHPAVASTTSARVCRATGSASLVAPRRSGRPSRSMPTPTATAAILAGVSRDQVLNLLAARALAERVGLIRATKAATSNGRSITAMPAKRERIDTTPGKKGGSHYVRRDREGKFTSDQTSVGRSVTQDRRLGANTNAPRGMKDRGD
jgi:hypothetical protein